MAVARRCLRSRFHDHHQNEARPMSLDRHHACGNPCTGFVFQVKLPCSRWRQTKGPEGETAFAHAEPRMRAIILSTKTGRTLEDHEAAAPMHRDYLDSNAVCGPTAMHRRGTTPKGDPFTYSTCTGSTQSGGKTFMAAAMIFGKQRGLSVRILFEGQSTMVSQSGQHLEPGRGAPASAPSLDGSLIALLVLRTRCIPSEKRR
ncbi:hypothetical protein BE20_51280 [Sorangium cellulosum]|uniref:Uncharacterized protein n=1 Tax=Sorangium cellulosum TaxID=56 RepID=A0A150TFG7_SORCE|nr:hypothetical protein BE20_51280 [Sorangium cellulosum]KYG03460.1 hypothetical protein BE18_32660 [Sorangium cellulosum]